MTDRGDKQMWRTDMTDRGDNQTWWTDVRDGRDGWTWQNDVTDRHDVTDGHDGRTWWTDVMDRRDGRTWWRDVTDRRDGRTWRTDVTDGRDNAHCYVCILFNEFTTSPRIQKLNASFLFPGLDIINTYIYQHTSVSGISIDVETWVKEWYHWVVYICFYILC